MTSCCVRPNSAGSIVTQNNIFITIMPNTNQDDLYISKRPFAFELQETQTQKTNKNIKSVSRDYRDCCGMSRSEYGSVEQTKTTWLAYLW